MSQGSDQQNQTSSNTNNDAQPGYVTYAPTYAITPPTYAIPAYGQPQPYTQPYPSYVQPNIAPAPQEIHQPRTSIHQADQDGPTKPGFLVYACGGICGLTILAFFIIGISVAIPWLGLFVIISLVPGLFILWLLYWKNYRNEAYITRVVKFLTFGMIGVIPVAIIELIFSAGFIAVQNEMNGKVASVGVVFFASITSAFLVAALCEEAFKLFLAYRITIERGKDTPNSVLIYSMSGALGLATLENMMYIVQVARTGNLAVTIFTAITRAVMAVPLHATTGVIIGADVAHNLFTPNQKPFYKIFMVPFLLHGFYDFCTMFASMYIAAYPSASWIFFLPFLSLATVIYGVLYAKKRRQATLTIQYNNYAVLEENSNFSL